MDDSLYFTEQHHQVREMVREFSRAEIAPVARELDRTSTFPWENIKKMGELGLLGVPWSEELGGTGMDELSYYITIHEMAKVDASHALTISAHTNLGTSPIVAFGTEEQRRRYVPLLASGRVLGGFGLTEPGAGSDAGGTRTTAVLEGGEWVINGSKAFITNSGTDITRLVTVTAVTDVMENGRKEISAIIVPSGTPGFHVAPKYSKVGWNCSDTHELSFSDVRVPLDNLVGVRGRGYAQFLSILDEGRVAIAALSVGLAQGCVDECLKYVKDRVAFGKRIGEYQAIQFKIADMEVRTHTARLAYYQAASKMLRGEPFKKEASIAKLVASNAAMDNARDATQIFGGYGFMNEFPVSRFYRDAKILEIGEGTSEVQKMLISRHLGVA
jgi:alkylation response protein AidB-like acyl-CoA dehydrogenase